METSLEHAVSESFPDPHAHLTTLTAPSTTSTPPSILDMTSYSQSTASAVTTYSLDLHGSGHPQQTHHYYSDFDWQSGAAAAAVPDTTQPPFYDFAADRATVQLYHHHHHGFSSAVPHHDLYATSPALWTHHAAAPGLVEDPSALAAQRYLPSLTTRTSGSSSASSSASSPTSSNTTTSASGKPKRRRVQSVTQRKAANVRERRRMFHLNSAFDELRKRLPAFNYEKRLSRIETLRLAMTYIGFMKDVMMGEDPRKVKLRPGNSSDAGSDLSHVDMESCTSEDPHHEDVDN